MVDPLWAVCFHTNSSSPRAVRWYYVARVIEVDGKWWQLYRHYSHLPRTNNRSHTIAAAKDLGLDLMKGLFTDAPSPRHGSEIVRVK